MRVKEIEIPIFETKVKMYLSKTTKDIFAELGDVINVWHESECYGFCTLSGGVVYIYVKEGKESNTINTISHEVYHAVNFVWQHMGASTGTEANDHEPLAYLQGWLMERAFKFYKPKK